MGGQLVESNKRTMAAYYWDGKQGINKGKADKLENVRQQKMSIMLEPFFIIRRYDLIRDLG
jgi:hypothetical protein